MKVAVIGSRELTVNNIGAHLPSECTEIVSGGARGVDRCAEKYARDMGIKFTVFLPDYDTHGKVAPLIRNKQIVEYSDFVLAFWNGVSRGTYFVIDYCKRTSTPYRIVYV
jgi:hypothetical protein